MDEGIERVRAEPGSALRRAAIAGNVESLHQLLNTGVSVDATDPNGWTALMLAAKYGKAEAVSYFVKQGAEVNHRNQFNTTALHCAIFRGHPEIVRFLLKMGADVNERYNTGVTPLMAATSHLEILQILIAAGAEINATDDSGNTVLWHATISGSMDCALFLLDNGAIVRLSRNLPESGPSALHKRNPITWAKLRKQDELVRRLEMAVVYDSEFALEKGVS